MSLKSRNAVVTGSTSGIGLCIARALAAEGANIVINGFGEAVDIERVAATRPLTTKRDDDDFPALAVAPDGTTALAWVAFTPGIDRDERARVWEKAPADFSFLAKPSGGDRIWFRTQPRDTWSEPVAVTGGGGDIFDTCTRGGGLGVCVEPS